MKPRLCRSFWKAFASPLHPSAALAHLNFLPPYDLVLWTNGSVPFSFGKSGSCVLANCSLCGTEVTLPFQQSQYALAFPLKPAPFCKLFAGLDSTKNSTISLPFSSYLTLALSSPPFPILHLSFYLNISGTSGRNCLLSSPVLSGYNGCLDTRFFPGNDAADEQARQGALLVPSAIPCSLSLFISHVHSSLFSDWRGTVSSKFFDTQAPSIFTKKLVPSLVFAATDTTNC